MVGVGTSGTRETIELARHAEGAGADAALVVSPSYWKVGEEALFRHFATVAESVGIPVVVYNLPMLTGVDLSPALIARIADECRDKKKGRDSRVPVPLDQSVDLHRTALLTRSLMPTSSAPMLTASRRIDGRRS